jgi:hypothetical protein
VVTWLLLIRGGSVREKRKHQLAQAAALVLRDGEQIEFMTVARVGQVARKKQIAVTVISTIITLGFLSLFLFSKSYYLVLTNMRLLFFGVAPGSGAPLPGIIREMSRSGMGATKPRSRLGITFKITSLGNAPLKLAFGQPQRKDAKALAAALVRQSPFGV